MGMGVGLVNPKYQFFDNNGDPLAAGMVFFYSPGTLIPRDTYFDLSLSVLNTNPIILDAAGRATIYLDTTLAYKMLVFDSAFNLVYAQDEIVEPLSSLYFSPDGTTWTGAINSIFGGGTAVPSGSIDGATISTTLTRAGTGTHPFFSGLALTAPVINFGGGAGITTAATLKIVGAPTGAVTNYAIYVTAGNSFFTGTITSLDIIRGTTLDGTQSGLAHGMTTLAPTDVHSRLTVYNSVNGGTRLFGLSKTDTGIVLSACVTSATASPPTGASVAPIVLSAGLKSGTTVATLGANKLIMVIQDNGTTRFAFDSDGDSFEDVSTGWTNFDNFDDLVALDSLAMQVSRTDDPYKDAIRRQFADSLTEMIPRADLVRMKLVTFDENGANPFLNTSKLAMLHTGALRQIGRELKAVAAQNRALVAELERLGGRLCLPPSRELTS